MLPVDWRRTCIIARSHGKTGFSVFGFRHSGSSKATVTGRFFLQDRSTDHISNARQFQGTLFVLLDEATWSVRFISKDTYADRNMSTREHFSFSFTLVGPARASFYSRSCRCVFYCTPRAMLLFFSGSPRQSLVFAVQVTQTVARVCSHAQCKVGKGMLLTI